MFEGFQGTFKKIVKKHGMQKPLEAAGVCKKFREFIKEKFPDAADFIVVRSFVDGILYIDTESAVWKQEVFMKRQKWLAEFNASEGFTIKELRIK